MLFHSTNFGKAELAVLAETDRLREELSYAARTPRRWYGLLRRSTFARVIQGSNSIEGYNVTVDDVAARYNYLRPRQVLQSASGISFKHS